MQVKLTYLLATSLLCFLLSSCFWNLEGSDFDTRGRASHPVVTVSQSSAEVGEFIEIRISNKIFAPTRGVSHAEEVELGLCLRPDWLEIPDNCKPVSPNSIDFQPSDDFSVEPEGAISKRETILIEEGKVIELSHTLRLTANRPREVILIGLFEVHDPDAVIPGSVGSVGPERAIVTFR